MSRGSITGVLAHAKSDSAAEYESSLERDFCLLLDFMPRVTSFETQPCAIDWTDAKGRRRRYTPDVLACETRRDQVPRTVLYEVKPHAVLC